MKSKRRGKIFIGIAVILALITVVALYGFLSSLENPVQEMVSVVYVNEPISARSVIGPVLLAQGKLEVREIPAEYAPASSIRVPTGVADDPVYLSSIISDTVTIVDLAPGDILQANHLDTNAGLAPGLRAVSLDMNQMTSVGGTIRPGNWVDIIVSYEREDEQLNKTPVTELLLQDREVLAVYGPSYYAIFSQAGGMAGVPSEEAGYYAPVQEARYNAEGEMMKDATVTLAVTPEEALKLAHASTFAKEVRLMIRRLDDLVPQQLAPIVSHSYR